MVIASCKKKIPDIDYPQEHYCEKFAGEYLMYDPLNDVHYEMIISCILDEFEFYDTISYSNYANRFDFKENVTPNETSHCLPSYIGTLTDHNGNSTVFSMGCYPPHPRNILRNDSLYIVFSINNLAYYIDEGVPWEICDDCLHYGVKIH